MAKDPTEPIRKKASQYAGVDEGTACTQSSFKVGKKSFLFIGEQGGRYKAMFKLKASIPEASKLAKKEPGRLPGWKNGLGNGPIFCRKADAEKGVGKMAGGKLSIERGSQLAFKKEKGVEEESNQTQTTKIQVADWQSRLNSKPP